MCWWPSMPTTFRCIGRARSTPARASSWIARRWPTGSAASARCCEPLDRGAWPGRRSGPAAACRRHAGAGAGAGPWQDQHRPAVGLRARRSAGRRQYAARGAVPLLRRSQGRAAARRISSRSRASCRPMAMPATTGSTATRSSRSLAGPMCGASSMTSTSTRAPSWRAEALERIGLLYDIEQASADQPAERQAVRQARAGPVLEELRPWLDTTLAPGPRTQRSPLPSATPARAGSSSVAIVTTAGWRSTTAPPSARSGRGPGPQELAVRRFRCRRPAAAAIYSLIETCKLNGLDPEAYLRHVLAASQITRQPRRRTPALEPPREARQRQSHSSLSLTTGFGPRLPKTRTAAAFKRATIGSGVADGRNNASQFVASKSLRPCSCAVGTFGRLRARVRDSTAGTFNRPASIWGLMAARFEQK